MAHRWSPSPPDLHQQQPDLVEVGGNGVAVVSIAMFPSSRAAAGSGAAAASSSPEGWCNGLIEYAVSRLLSEAALAAA